MMGAGSGCSELSAAPEQSLEVCVCGRGGGTPCPAALGVSAQSKLWKYQLEAAAALLVLSKPPFCYS